MNPRPSIAMCTMLRRVALLSGSRKNLCLTKRIVGWVSCVVLRQEISLAEIVKLLGRVFCVSGRHQVALSGGQFSKLAR